MEAFGIIKLIFGTTFLGLMMLTGIYNDESFYKVILAVIMTFGLVYGVGQLPYAFLIFIILGIFQFGPRWSIRWPETDPGLLGKLRPSFPQCFMS